MDRDAFQRRDAPHKFLGEGVSASRSDTRHRLIAVYAMRADLRSTVLADMSNWQGGKDDYCVMDAESVVARNPDHAELCIGIHERLTGQAGRVCRAM